VTTTTAAAPGADIPAGYWQREASHNPRPLSTLGANVFIEGVSQSFPKMFAEFGMLLQALEYREIGGYAYNSLVPLGGRSERPLPPKLVLWFALRAAPAFRKRLKRCKEALSQRLDRQLVERWYGEWRPKLAADIERLRAVDLASLSDAALAAHVEELPLDLPGNHPLYLTRRVACLYGSQACERRAGLRRSAHHAPARQAAASATAILARPTCGRGDDGLVATCSPPPRDVPRSSRRTATRGPRRTTTSSGTTASAPCATRSTSSPCTNSPS
jgi:hypothetical protein